MRNTYHLLALASVVAHHGIESAAGIGLPGQPDIGGRRVAVLWTAAFSGNVYLLTHRGQRHGLLAAFANGAYQALALQHYVDWPWVLRKGVPVIQEAEGLPGGGSLPTTRTCDPTVAARVSPASSAVEPHPVNQQDAKLPNVRQHSSPPSFR